MKEIVGQDIFDQINVADAIAITTNCSISSNGENPMGGGLAGAAARLWEDLPKVYGKLLTIMPNVPCIIGYVSKKDNSKFVSALENNAHKLSPNQWTSIVAYPTMLEITEPANLLLVKRSAKLLVELADLFYWNSVYTGRAGCGIGSLSWEQDVKPELSNIFDDRFIIMHK